MEGPTDLIIRTQPDDTTCGPTCLEAVYRYFGDESMTLEALIGDVPHLEGGGTLGELLGMHALTKGYGATIYTFNLELFDPSWFQTNAVIQEKLRQQAAAKDRKRLRRASDAYIEFLDAGGIVQFEELNAALLRELLCNGYPVLTGLCASYLYQEPREVERGNKQIPDDVRGTPVGHFVVLCGYDSNHDEILVADPLHKNPFADGRKYRVGVERVIGAILLGVLTYDACLLIIEPRS